MNNANSSAKFGMSLTKKLLVALCALAAVVTIVVTSVLATVAYLTSSAAVSNVFTVGNVSMTMTESKVGADGKKITMYRGTALCMYKPASHRGYPHESAGFQ